MNSFVVGAVDTAAFMLCITFLSYVVLIAVPLLRRRPTQPGDPTSLTWHFLIPCLDEERVIESTAADLFRKFPAAHIWCIDDNSRDATPVLLARMAQRSPRVHVVSRRFPDAQQGKGPALNAGWRAIVRHLGPGDDLDRIIVGVLDADGVLDPKCPSILAGPEFFGDPRVSSVQTQVRVVNLAGDSASSGARLLTSLQDQEFTTVFAGMQMLRRHVGSAAMGGNGQFARGSALQKVSEAFGAPWADTLTEDFELGLRVLLTGGRTEYCREAWVAQQGSPKLGKLLRQRSRWAQGMMQCFRYLRPVLLSPKISTPAAAEIAYFLCLPWIQLIGTLAYVGSSIVLAYSALSATSGVVHWVRAGAWGLIPLFLFFGLGPIVMWGPIYRRTVAPELSWRHGVWLGLLNWPYIYINHAATWWAFGRVLRSRKDWKKTERLDLPESRPLRKRGVSEPVGSAGHGTRTSAPGGAWVRPTTGRLSPGVKASPPAPARGRPAAASSGVTGARIRPLQPVPLTASPALRGRTTVLAGPVHRDVPIAADGGDGRATGKLRLHYPFPAASDVDEAQDIYRTRRRRGKISVRGRMHAVGDPIMAAVPDRGDQSPELAGADAPVA